MDEEDLHQLIYKEVHARVRDYLETAGLANAIWLGTECAAKTIRKLIDEK